MSGLFEANWTIWAAVIGSGVFHGVNPAMGWLFANGQLPLALTALRNPPL